MRLEKGGREVVWEEGEQGEFDDKILALQKKYPREGLSIWGTKGCDNCGACCYRFAKSRKRSYKKCKHMEINGNSNCLKQDDKPEECKTWDCYSPFNPGLPEQRYQLLRIAVDILGTKKEEDILNLIE